MTTQSTPGRGRCVCGKECSINGDGTLRHHQAPSPEFYAGPDSKRCKGAGGRPAGEPAPVSLPETATGYVCRVPAGPEGCGRPVLLTSNNRARSHLDNAGNRCGGGSDWPLAVAADGTRTDTAPAGEVLPAARPEDLQFGSEDPVEDFLGTGGPTVPEPAAGPGDGRTEPQPGSALIGLMGAEVGDPGTVLDWLGFGEPEEAPTAEDRTFAGDDGAGGGVLADEALFDRTHKVTDESGTEWIHSGRAEDCTALECCLHPQGFVYGDDGKGHSGTVCPDCGSEPHAPEPGWRTPDDLLIRMPADVVAMAGKDPVCWYCEHPVIPLVERFGLHGEPEAVTWGCETNCENKVRTGHPDRPCRPRAPGQYRLEDMRDGSLFVRHTQTGPLRPLVYRVQRVRADGLDAVVVSAGPYGGREGTLTNLTEEVTCTDLQGRPRQGTSPLSSPEAPAPAPSPVPDRSSTPVTTASAPSAPNPSGKGTSSGPTATEATSTRSAPVTTTEGQAAADFLGAASGSHGEAEAKYGRWGRYRLTHPATGRTVEWTRATTFAKSISDTFTLAQWGKRNVLLGATLRPDIVAAAHGKDITQDRDQLNTWCEELEQAAGSKVAANLGTAVHSFTERVDRRWSERWEVFKEIPNEFKPHVKAYILLLEEHGLEPVPHMIEFSTGVLQYEVMGTSDNCYRATRHLVLKMPRGEVRLSPGEHVIGDKKTGKDLDYGWQEICIQLALYVQGVNTQGVYNWADDRWDADPLSRFAEPGTKVREDVGVILHLPVDPRSKKHPALYGVDLESGWNAVVLCERVRAWRKLRSLAGLVVVADKDLLAEERSARPQTDAGALRKVVRPPTLRERAEAVTSRSEASKVYQDALAAKVPVAEAKELIDIMQKAISKVAEPGGAKV